MKSRIIEITAFAVTSAFLTACFAIRDLPYLWQVGAVITLGNFLLIFYGLFIRGTLSRWMFLLAFVQVAVFGRLFMIMDAVREGAHFAHSVPVSWADWGSFVGVNALKAADIIDFMDLFEWGVLLKIRPVSINAGLGVVTLNALTGIMGLGLIFIAVNREFRLDYGSSFLIRSTVKGLLGMLVVSVFIAWGMRWNTEQWSTWFVWNIFHTLDVADALTVFGMPYTQPARAGLPIVGMTVLYRLLLAAFFVMAVNAVFMRMLGKKRFILRLADFFRDESAPLTARADAVRRTGDFGAAAAVVIPRLIPLLTESRSQLRTAALNALEKMDPRWPENRAARKTVPILIRDLNGKDRERRITSVRILTKMGPSAEGAAAALARMLSDEDAGIRKAAGEALSGMGDAAFPAISRMLEKSEGDGLGTVLDEIHPRWRETEAVSRLRERSVRMLKEGDEAGRRNAVRALERIGPQTGEMLPGLIPMLGDNNVRLSVIRLLGMAGDEGETAMPHLVRLLADGDRNVIRQAEEALGGLDPDWRESEAVLSVIEEFIGALGAEEERGFDDPEEGLVRIGSRAIPALALALADTDRMLQQKANRTLRLIEQNWHLAESVKKAVPGLVRALSYENWYVRSSAAKVLAKIGPGASKAIPRLVKALADPNRNVREAAKAAMDRVVLKDAGGKAPAAPGTPEEREKRDRAGLPPVQSARQEVIRLADRLSHPDPEVRAEAAVTLGKIQPPPMETVEHLAARLGDREASVRKAAAVALETIDAAWRSRACIRDAVLRFIRLMAREEAGADHPVEGLRKVGPPAIRYLTPLLPNPARALADAAAQMLKTIDPAWAETRHAAAAVPDLVKSLGADKWYVRKTAADVLGTIGPGAVKAMPHLVKRLSDPNRAVREACKAAMDKILLKKSGPKMPKPIREAP